jgi:hypothetical protein
MLGCRTCNWDGCKACLLGDKDGSDHDASQRKGPSLMQEVLRLKGAKSAGWLTEVCAFL